MKQAYIVTGYRTAVGKAPRGLFRFKRPDELAAETIEHMMKDLPQLDKSRIDDVIVGNAMPEGGLLIDISVRNIPENKMILEEISLINNYRVNFKLVCIAPTEHFIRIPK